MKTAVLLFTLFFLYQQSVGQGRVLSGRVLDSVTQAPLSGVSIRVGKGVHGTLTDSTGHFRLVIESATRQLTISIIGYSPRTMAVGYDTSLTILMSRTYTEMGDVVVKVNKRKYRNKDNPAVELIREVIDHKSSNVLSAYPFATFQQYNKTVLAFDNLPHQIVDAKLLRKYRFLFENVDSTKVPGKKLVPVYITEALSREYSRSHPEKTKSLVLGQKSVNFGEFVDMRGLNNIISRMYGNLDANEDHIDLFGTQLLSPLAPIAPTFYMYFILDTTVQDGVQVVKMYFMPRNPDDLLFRGTLWVTLDNHYALWKADMSVSKHINLNFVRSFRIDLNYARDSAGEYYLSKSDMVADLGVTHHGFGLWGERTISNTGFRTAASAPDSLFHGLPQDSAAQASHPPDSIWKSARSVTLSPAEARAYKNVDSLAAMKSFHRIADWLTALTQGWKQAGPVNFGQINTFYTFNPVEGSRAKFGFRTTPKLSHTVYAETYAAYGFLDRKWKYDLNLTYSFNHRNIFNDFPLHYLQAGYQKDTKIPGQLNNFSSTNTFQTSFTQGPDSQWLYNQIAHLDYFQEFRSHLSFDLGYQYWQQMPAGSVYYLYQKGPTGFDTVHSLTTSTLSGTLRWAPHEQFIMNQFGRSDVTNRYPIITFTYTRGFKGLAGGQYDFNAFLLNVYKRFYLSPIGYTDITLGAGYLTGKLPFPLLIIQPANETYVYYDNAFNLMDFEEFVSDHYASLYLDHYFNGFFLDKVPWIKWFKLREVVEAKVIFGGVRSENNPALNPEQMRFPTTGGATSTFVLNAGPYVEAGVGVLNFFKIFRVDLVWRMTYLNHPFVSPLGLRLSYSLNF